jgi:hypothetical protein
MASYEDAIKPLLVERNRRLKKALGAIRATSANPRDRHVRTREAAADLIARAAQTTDVRVLDMQIEAMQHTDIWKQGLEDAET